MGDLVVSRLDSCHEPAGRSQTYTRVIKVWCCIPRLIIRAQRVFFWYAVLVAKLEVE